MDRATAVPPPRGSGVTPGKIRPTDPVRGTSRPARLGRSHSLSAWRCGQESIGRTEVRREGRRDPGHAVTAFYENYPPALVSDPGTRTKLVFGPFDFSQ
jgi:hypothetical protein